VTSILLVEDEAAMALILRDNLELEGYEVHVAQTGEKGVEWAFQKRPDLILLDLMLPRMSGYEVCSKLRAGSLNVPIVMVSARNQELDRVAGLELGADDYIGKPFSVRELMARVRVHLRRRESSREALREFAFGDVVIDLEHNVVTKRSRKLNLSSRELDLLQYLVAHRREVLTRERLLMDVWGLNEDTMTRTVDNFIAKLRKKIEPRQSGPRYIQTVQGVGYRFVD
jgi:DNA-binding response OmpR family regulator